MSKKLLCLSIGALSIVPFIAADVQASSTLASSFSCINDEAGLATVVNTKTGKQVPIIYWKSEVFSGSGWTPERRCHAVSARFQNFHSSGTLEYVTTGRINGLPVICIAKSEGASCSGLLYTLKPGQNAVATLQKIFDIRTKPGAAPLEETTSRVYLSMDSIIRNQSGLAATASPIKPVPSSSSTQPLF